jgi:hypothetical protein
MVRQRIFLAKFASKLMLHKTEQAYTTGTSENLNVQKNGRAAGFNHFIVKM